jgi:hypothetical protein
MADSLYLLFGGLFYPLFRDNGLTVPISIIQIRLAEKNNAPILLVFAPVYGVASTGTYNKYAPADAPCRRTQIRRLLVELFFPPA